MALEESNYERLRRNSARGEVLVLGAGFSHSVHPAFPLTDYLGVLARAVSTMDFPKLRERGLYQVSLADLNGAARERVGGFPGGTFETWMSYLAEAQPYLSSVQRSANRAQYMKLAESLWAVLTLIEDEVATEELPRWFYRLLSVLHARRATVVTFNYDRLIETGIERLDLGDFSSQYRGVKVQWHSPLHDLPSPPALPGLLGEERVDTLRLCKLHGSLNWYWVPGDTNGQSLNRWTELGHSAEVFRAMPGREPFLVPPTSSKSAFFTSPVLSEIWRQARESIWSATSLDIVGYSLPLTDLTAAGMMTSALHGRTLPICVVNPFPLPVQDAVRSLTDIEATTCSSVEEYAESLVHKASTAVVDQILESAAEAGDTRLVVGWNRELLARVRTLRREGNTVVLSVGECDGHATAAVSTEGVFDESRSARRVAELAAVARYGDEAVIEFPNGSRSTVVGIDGFSLEVGASTHWQVLQPADRAASIGVTHQPYVGVPR